METKAKTTQEFRAARMEFAKKMIQAARERGITEIPPDEICQAAIDGILRRDGKTYSNPPAFLKNPFANILLRMISWHGSGGNLHGMMFAQLDCRFLSKAGENPRENETATFKTQAALAMGRNVFDEFNTLALVLRAGKSRAADAWHRAFYGE